MIEQATRLQSGLAIRRMSASVKKLGPVSWKTLSYDCTKDNGRKITLKDIGEGDIIILIDELDKTFDE